MIKNEIDRIQHVNIGTSQKIQNFLKKNNSTPLTSGIKLVELARRPELSYKILEEIDEGRPELPEDVIEQVDIHVKYEGYIKRQERQVEQFKKMEEKKIPADINLSLIHISLMIFHRNLQNRNLRNSMSFQFFLQDFLRNHFI